MPRLQCHLLTDEIRKTIAAAHRDHLRQRCANNSLNSRQSMRQFGTAANFEAKTRLDCDDRAQVYTLTFLGQGEHRINPDFVLEVESHLETVLKDKRPVALVTRNEGRCWSNGLDIDWIKEDPLGRLESGVQSLLQLVKRFLELPLPTVASLTGHAAGGGFVLALAHDYRYMKKHRNVLYLSGVDIGVPHPPGANALLRSKMRPEVYRDAVLYGFKYKADDAVRAGLVQGDSSDQSPPPDIDKVSHDLATRLAQRNFCRKVYGAMKCDMYSEVLGLLETGGMGNLDKVGLFGEMLQSSRTPGTK